MINPAKIQEKTVAFVNAYVTITEAMKRDVQNKCIAFEAEIDDKYLLIASFNGAMYSITEKNHELVYAYFQDDDWTIGDLLGGYLDLYFTK